MSNFNLLQPNTYNINAATLYINGDRQITDTNSQTGSLIVEGGAFLNGDVRIGGNLTVPNITYETVQVVTSTTNSTSNSTGALIVYGGAGIAKDMYIGGNIHSTNIYGNLVTTTVNSNSSSTGSIIINGGIGIAKDLYIGGTCNTEDINCSDIISDSINTTSAIINTTLGVSGVANFNDTSDSLNYANGSIITAGGLGVAKNIRTNGDIYCNNIYGSINVTGTAESSSISTGSVIVPGGVGISKNVYIGGNLNVAATGVITTLQVTGTTTNSCFISGGNDSTSTDTGALKCAGGVGILKNLNVGGVVKLSDTTFANSSTQGCMILAGGIGVGKNVYCNQLSVGSTTLNTDIYSPTRILNTTGATDTSTGALICSGGASIKNALYVGGNVNCASLYNSVSYSNNSVILASVVVSDTTTKTLAYNDLGTQIVTGTTTHIFKLNNTGMQTGHMFKIINLSTGTVTVNNSVPTLINTILTNTMCTFTYQTTDTWISSNLLNISQRAIYANDTTSSSSTITGAFICAGGCGIAKDIFAGGKLTLTSAGTIHNIAGLWNIQNTIQSTDSLTGVLRVAGGAGISKDLYVGGTCTTDLITSNSQAYGIYRFPVGNTLTQLANSISGVIRFYGTGIHTIMMPMTNIEGRRWTFYNAATGNITVQDNNNVQLSIILPNHRDSYIYNSTDGWIIESAFL